MQTPKEKKMLSLTTIFAAAVLFAFAGCQTQKQASLTACVGPSSKLYYEFDESFLAFLGPGGLAAIERALRENPAASH
jgi:hypothetical protein